MAWGGSLSLGRVQGGSLDVSPSEAHRTHLVRRGRGLKIHAARYWRAPGVLGAPGRWIPLGPKARVVGQPDLVPLR